jgi:ferric-dicitrate binding protein FerR (iron transport regulator)
MKNLHKMITDGTLIGKYLSGASGDDAKVKSWLNEDPKNDALYKELQNEEKLADVLDELDQFNGEKAWLRFTSNRIFSFRNTYMRWLKIAAVFVLVIGLSSVMVYYFTGKEKTESFTEANKIRPGGPKAYLVLANGSVVNLTELDHSQKKQLKKSTGFEVTGNTVIARKNVKPVKEKEKTQYHTLVIPKGGEYKIVLEDSTEVWLNADSKLKFPNEFSAGIRDVELVGEAWFKVKKDRSCPFLVRLNDMDIKVLGTEFNTSAYPDDPTVTTTLINGLVTVYYKTGITGQQNLLPGDQASYHKKESTIHLETVDVAKFKAWKDGFFVFDNQPLSDVTRVLERWYNVQFIIQDEDLRNAKFSGQFLRYDDIRVVFDIIRKTGTNVKFIKEGRIIKITS